MQTKAQSWIFLVREKKFYQGRNSRRRDLTIPSYRSSVKSKQPNSGLESPELYENPYLLEFERAGR